MEFDRFADELPDLFHSIPGRNATGEVRKVGAIALAAPFDDDRIAPLHTSSSPACCQMLLRVFGLTVLSPCSSGLLLPQVIPVVQSREPPALYRTDEAVERGQGHIFFIGCGSRAPV
jgi:hypothetical protein